MTKTEARKLAAERLSHGHYRAGFNGIKAQCPRCREWVERPWYGGDNFRPNTSRHETALREAIVEHLVEWCEAAR